MHNLRHFAAADDSYPHLSTCPLSVSSLVIRFLCQIRHYLLLLTQPFTAPAVAPAIKYFCTNRKRIRVGTMAKVADAIRLPQSVPYCCMKDWIPTGTVIRFSSRRKMLEIKNSLERIFSVVRNELSATVKTGKLTTKTTTIPIPSSSH